jgi:hypothetical protein
VITAAALLVDMYQPPLHLTMFKAKELALSNGEEALPPSPRSKATNTYLLDLRKFRSSLTMEKITMVCKG